MAESDVVLYWASELPFTGFSVVNLVGSAYAGEIIPGYQASIQGCSERYSVSQLKRSGDVLCHERGICVAESGAVDSSFVEGVKASMEAHNITSLKHERGCLTWSGEHVILKATSAFERVRLQANYAVTESSSKHRVVNDV